MYLIIITQKANIVESLDKDDIYHQRYSVMVFEYWHT